MNTNSKDDSTGEEKIIPTICAAHCGGSCLLKCYVKDGVITRVETDDGPEPQLRGCLKGRAARQYVYSPERLLYPMKRGAHYLLKRICETLCTSILTAPLPVLTSKGTFACASQLTTAFDGSG